MSVTITYGWLLKLVSLESIGNANLYAIYSYDDNWFNLVEKQLVNYADC